MNETLQKAVKILRDARPKGISRTELSIKMDCDIKTVDRTVTNLEKLGFEFDRPRSSKNSKVQLLLLQKEPEFSLTTSINTRIALWLAGQFMDQCGASIWSESLNCLAENISKDMSQRDKAYFEELKAMIQIKSGIDEAVERTESSLLLGPILEGIREKRQIEVEYQGIGDEKAHPRPFMPHSLTYDMFSGCMFLTGMDPKDHRPKNLRLSRIEKATLTSKPSLITLFDVMDFAAKYQIGGWICSGDPFTVRAEIQGKHWIDAINAAKPQLPDFTIDISPSGERGEIRFMANHPNGALRWLLQFGEAIRVLEPEDLRQQLHEKLKRAAARYEEPVTRQEDRP